MTDRKLTNVAASVRQRLLNLAKAEGRVFQELATLYVMERFLYRLGRSPHAEHFVLKGGLMTLTWAGEHARVTRDIDLLGRGASTVDAVMGRVREVLYVEADDGVRFDVGSASGSEITVDAAYVGVRVVFRADLAGMVIKMRVDVGFGDAVVPEPAGWSTRSSSTSAHPGCSATRRRRRWPSSCTPSWCSVSRTAG